MIKGGVNWKIEKKLISFIKLEDQLCNFKQTKAVKDKQNLGHEHVKVYIFNN